MVRITFIKFIIIIFSISLFFTCLYDNIFYLILIIFFLSFYRNFDGKFLVSRNGEVFAVNSQNLEQKIVELLSEEVKDEL